MFSQESPSYISRWSWADLIFIPDLKTVEQVDHARYTSSPPGPVSVFLTVLCLIGDFLLKPESPKTRIP